jgi:hypothetical protein
MTAYYTAEEVNSLFTEFNASDATGSTGPTGPSGINGTRLFIVSSEDTTTEGINAAIYSKYGATASVWDSVILTNTSDFYEFTEA